MAKSHNTEAKRLWLQSRSLAIELAPDIRVNGVGPGLIYLEDSSQWSHLVRNIPMGRMGTVDEIAACVRFCCLDQSILPDKYSMLMVVGVLPRNVAKPHVRLIFSSIHQ